MVTHYETLRQLRCKVLEFIVHEAGERCNPYWENGDLYERIEARLGRTKDIVFPRRPDYTGPGFERVAAPEKIAQLSARPLFSEDADKMLPLAYEELKKIRTYPELHGSSAFGLEFFTLIGIV